jgi:hypothetical protein
MARFSELQEQDKIQYVKDEFILILEDIAKDKGKIEKFLPLPELKKDANAEQQSKYEAVKAQREKVLEIVGGLTQRKGCLCGSCLDLNVSNGLIPEALEPLVDAAKHEAESKSY